MDQRRPKMTHGRPRRRKTDGKLVFPKRPVIEMPSWLKVGRLKGLTLKDVLEFGRERKRGSK